MAPECRRVLADWAESAVFGRVAGGISCLICIFLPGLCIFCRARAARPGQLRGGGRTRGAGRGGILWLCRHSPVAAAPGRPEMAWRFGADSPAASPRGDSLLRPHPRSSRAGARGRGVRVVGCCQGPVFGSWEFAGPAPGMAWVWMEPAGNPVDFGAIRVKEWNI